ncbi:hypothetical protein PUN28_000053 [Cardiocondyla obscurior]|uniref:Uncharacterized protein n=1 Tax=Cardiocondyla obscurior TaxID=286306 RepID=A0AAW2GXX8_9HYME
MAWNNVVRIQRVISRKDGSERLEEQNKLGGKKRNRRLIIGAIDRLFLQGKFVSPRRDDKIYIFDRLIKASGDLARKCESRIEKKNERLPISFNFDVVLSKIYIQICSIRAVHLMYVLFIKVLKLQHYLQNIARTYSIIRIIPKYPRIIVYTKFIQRIDYREVERFH